MRNAIVLSLALSALLEFAGPARADYASSQSWFQSLAPEQRAEAQSNLILLGDYLYLVDGKFGAGTYEALTEFQRELGAAQTGALTASEQQALKDKAAKVASELGITPVRDDEGRVSLPVPTRLLPQSFKTGRGTKWTTEDGGMTVETILTSGQDTTFADLFEQLRQNGKGRLVTTAEFSDTVFLLRGHQDGRDFYAMYRKTPSGSVGYQLTWSLGYAQRGKVLSVYIASNFTPLSAIPEDGGLAKTGGSTSNRRFGAFALPVSMPDAIALDGEVSGSFYEDFRRALDARPDARVMVLNSPGGSVTSALAVAWDVHERGMSTIVRSGAGCYSACAYIFFAGKPREADGELGVHQISAEVADNVLTQTTLGDIIDALNTFGVDQRVIVTMLHTPPEDIYVFSPTELSAWEVNRGGAVQIAEASPSAPSPSTNASPAPAQGTTAFVHLARHNTEAEARRTLKYAADHWASVLSGARPQMETEATRQGTIYQILVPALSIENATAICSAIKSAGGGCYVTGQ